jgi:hypothetical protein
MMRSKARFAGIGVLFLVAAAALGAVVMMLWNAIIPGLFAGARSIDYLHALGLLVLSRILFGGFHGHRGGGRRHRAKWQAMTPEEREQFRRCGPWGGRPSEQA